MIALLFKPTYTKPSNDFEARLLGIIAVEEFNKNYGPPKKGQGTIRFKQFVCNNPNTIVTGNALFKDIAGWNDSRNRRSLFKEGYITRSSRHDEGLKGNEYRIIGYDPSVVNTNFKCPNDLRGEIIARAGGKCQSCGYVVGTIHPHSGQYEILEAHRPIPGSLYTLEGCLAYCVSCNNGIGDKLITLKSPCEIVTELALKYGCAI
jgi:hypothetical protein